MYRRTLLLILTVFVTLLFLSMIGLWVRSYFVGDSIRHHNVYGNRHGFSSTNGTLLFEREFNEIYGGSVPAHGFVYRELDPARFRVRNWTTQTQWRFAGFGLIINTGTVLPSQLSARAGVWQNTVVLIPHWFFVAVLAALAGLLIRRLTRKTTTEGYCENCGYDLCASKNACPECGTPIPVLPDS